MRPSDADSIRKVDALAFGLESGIKRKKKNILAPIRFNPACFVAEAERVIGYIFSHTWGNMAWVGTFGVHPEYQGNDIGKQLLHKALKKLEDNYSLIGLETMADSPYNIGMYAKHGFYLTSPTLVLTKPVEKTSEYPSQGVEVESRLDEKEINMISSLSNAVVPGLDYTKVAKSAIKYQWGTIFFLDPPNPSGFGILRTSSRFENQTKKSLEPRVLVLNSKSKQLFSNAIEKIETFAQRREYKNILLPVNGMNREAIQWALEHEYNVKDTKIRMLSRGEYSVNGIDCCWWGM